MSWAFHVGGGDERVLGVHQRELAVVGAGHSFGAHDRARLHAGDVATTQEHDGDATRFVDEWRSAMANVWLPAVLEGRGDAQLRVAPITHSGELLGIIVVERAADRDAFSEEEEQLIRRLNELQTVPSPRPKGLWSKIRESLGA